MKYLDYPTLNQLSMTLSNEESPDMRVHVRVEAYSIKPGRDEKKQFKEMEEAYMSGQDEMEEMSFSPEMVEAEMASPFGRLDEKESRKVHFLLVSTLNCAFPENEFGSLRPDHFTREVSAIHVLGHLNGSLLGPSNGDTQSLLMAQAPAGQVHFGVGSAPVHMSPLNGSSSNHSPPAIANPDVHRILNEVVPLDECEVYSWFPRPEYDPHFEAEDGEGSDLDIEEEVEEFLPEGEMDIDVNGEESNPAWGPGGMELDDVPSPAAMERTRLMTGSPNRSRERGRVADKIEPMDVLEDQWEGGLEKRSGPLLWSANYFFYSKRQKRVLFLTCWCRKRYGQQSTPPEDQGSYPLPISASHPSAPGPPSFHKVPLNRQPRSAYNRSHARRSNRKSKQVLKVATDKDIIASTIPIRGMETPRATRMASSAPSAMSPLSTVATPAALAKMSAHGFKPRQTPSRVQMNAAAAKRQGPNSVPVANEGIGGGVRKERSESGPPGPSALPELAETSLDGKIAVSSGKGKRVKV